VLHRYTILLRQRLLPKRLDVRRCQQRALRGDSVILSSVALYAAWDLIARVLLSVVFAVAGIAKLRDMGATEAMLRDFGVSARVSDTVARALPVLELTIALALLPTMTARWAAIAGIALLTIFTGAVAYNLSIGRRPDCRCFGQVAAAPIGPATIGRNVLLSTLALSVATVRGGFTDRLAIAWLGQPTVIAATIVVALLVAQLFFSWQIVAQQGRILGRLDALDSANGSGAPQSFGVPGLPVGAHAPSFELPALDGSRVALADLLGHRRIALLFVHPGCGPCIALIPDIARWDRDLRERLAIVVLSERSAEENRPLFAEDRVDVVLLQAGREVADAYQAYGTPTAVIVEPNGTIGSAPAPGGEAIAALIAAATISTNGAALVSAT
jgi:uncharacterized membrane protein YphA (DoxX/SURF4 family)/thiol-disulfide isomerase/thioredoxin